MKELPEECWELILKRLAPNERDFRSPSLACKQFLSITNRVRRKFSAFNKVLYHNRCKALYRALERFPNIKELELCGFYNIYDPNPNDYVNIEAPIVRIASFGLDIRSFKICSSSKPLSANSFRALGSTMRNLKRLICWQIRSLADVHIVAIADGLPWLEELGIICINIRSHDRRTQYPNLSNRDVTDAGIEVISNKLRGLSKIEIKGYHRCSDLSLIALSSNCVGLEEIRCFENGITKDGIGFVLYHSPNLISLTAHSLSTRNSSFSFDASKICATTLRELDLSVHSPGPLLCSIAKAGISLEKLILHYNDGWSFNGLSTLLCACPSLKHLELWNVRFLCEDSLGNLCRYLANVVSVTLSRCGNLSIATFFMLAKECPALSEIKLHCLSSVSLNVDYVFDMDLERNYQIGSLDLSHNCHLKDELLRQVVNTCPNLHTLYVQHCIELTTDGIGGILNHCPQIKHLGVDKRMEVLAETFKTRRIEVGFC